MESAEKTAFAKAETRINKDYGFLMFLMLDKTRE